MKSFEIKVILNDTEQLLTAQEDRNLDTYLITKNQKFITRLFRDTEGRWKTHEVSDLSPSDINTIGEEIKSYLNANR